MRFKNETRTNKRNEKSFGKPQRRKRRTTNPFYFPCKQNEQRREPSFHYLGSNSNFNFNACFSFFFKKKCNHCHSANGCIVFKYNVDRDISHYQKAESEQRMDVLECNVMHLDIPALNFDTQMKSLTFRSHQTCSQVSVCLVCERFHRLK